MAGKYSLDRRYLAYLLLFYSVVTTLYCWLPPTYFSAKSGLAWHKSLPSQDQRNSFAQNSSDVVSEFPRKIWQTAKDNLPALDAVTRSSIQTWMDQNKFYRYELITAARDESYVADKYAHRPELVRDFLSLQDPMLRADLVQYLFLLADGGVYTDLDTKCLKPIDAWIPSVFKEKANLVLGIEGDSLDGPLISGFSHPVQFATWTMAVKPRHFMIELIIDRVMTQLRKLAENQNVTIGEIKADYMDVMDTTGPGVFAESIYQGLSQISSSNVTSANLTGMTEPRLFGDVLVLPITAFGAGIGHSNAGDLDDPSALVHHTFAGTWKADHPMGGDVADVVGEDEGLKAKKMKEKLKEKYKVTRRRKGSRPNLR